MFMVQKISRATLKISSSRKFLKKNAKQKPPSFQGGQGKFLRVGWAAKIPKIGGQNREKTENPDRKITKKKDGGPWGGGGFFDFWGGFWCFCWGGGTRNQGGKVNSGGGPNVKRPL